MFASQECSSACVALFSYGNYKKLEQHELFFILSVVQALLVILLSDTSSIQFQSLLFRITALPGCVAPFSSIGLNWSNMSCSSFYVQ